MTRLFKIQPTGLTIAGFDPSGGAGVIADLRTFESFGVQGLAAITSITHQNSERVMGAVHQSGESVRSQVMPLLESAQIACAKTGMLPTHEVVNAVADIFQNHKLPSPVVDPVIKSSSGFTLMDDGALAALLERLLPLAALLTPNIAEAETITGRRITNESDLRSAAAEIRKLGARAVLVKGGHLPDTIASTDVLDNQGSVTVFRQERIPHANLHGSGCILSAAIAAGLGKGMTLEDSIRTAKNFVLEAIKKDSEEL